MRVTFGMLTNNVKTRMVESSNQLLIAQDRASSGRKINKPSDDVPGTGRCLNYSSALASIEQFKTNSTLAASRLSVTSSTLDSVITQIQKAQELGLKAGSATATEGSADSIMAQLDKITDQLRSLANIQHLDKYIFAGSPSNHEPIVASGGNPPYQYVGDSEQFSVEVGPGITVPTTVTGDIVFNMNSASVAGAPDIFTAISDLRSAIDSGNVNSMSAQLQGIKDNLDNVISVRSQVGASLRQVQSNQTALEDSKTSISELLSQDRDVDMAESIIDLQTKSNLFEAAKSVAAKVIQTTLADFLK